MAQNILISDKVVEQFRSDLEVFVREALSRYFPNVDAANKFRVENRGKRAGLKRRARSLGLNFKLEVSGIQERFILEEKINETQGKKARRHYV